MRSTSAVLSGLAGLVLATGSAQAQQSDWQYEGSVYLFMPKTTATASTPLGTLSGSLSFRDNLSNLDGAFMASLGASNGRWSFTLDYMLTDLSMSNPLPGPVLTGVNFSVRTQIVSGYAAYRIVDVQSLDLDLAAGFRWFDVDATLSAVPAPPGLSVALQDNWITPVVGMRAQVRFSDDWTGTAFVDYGGFRNDDNTWQVLLSADSALNENWLIRAGYRHLEFDHAAGPRSLSVRQSGPIVGVTYRF
jgi:opacity protein-like surface antigen